jgi:hypothetical protein
MNDPIEMKKEIARAYDVDPNTAIEPKPKPEPETTPMLMDNERLPDGIGVRLVDKNHDGKPCKQYFDLVTKKVVANPFKRLSPAESAMQRSQKFLSTKIKKIQEPVTVEDKINRSLLEIVERGTLDSKASTAAVNAAKQLRENAHGQAPKSSLDKGETDDHRIRYVVINNPNIPFENDPRPPTPLAPSWELKRRREAGEYIPELPPVPQVEVLSISTNPKPETKE